MSFSFVSESLLLRVPCVFFFFKFCFLSILLHKKVTVGKIVRSKVTLLIQPFAMCVAVQRDQKIVGHTIKHIFDALLYQSDLGRVYQEKFDAWKSVNAIIHALITVIPNDFDDFIEFNRWASLAHPSTI